MRYVTLYQCFLVDALLAATGSGGAFILIGHLTSCVWQLFFFPAGAFRTPLSAVDLEVTTLIEYLFPSEPVTYQSYC